MKLSRNSKIVISTEGGVSCRRSGETCFSTSRLNLTKALALAVACSYNPLLPWQIRGRSLVF
jgi:hypothetical protein